MIDFPTSNEFLGALSRLLFHDKKFLDRVKWSLQKLSLCPNLTGIVHANICRMRNADLKGFILIA